MLSVERPHEHSEYTVLVNRNRGGELLCEGFCDMLRSGGGFPAKSKLMLEGGRKDFSLDNLRTEDQKIRGLVAQSLELRNQFHWSCASF